jgi:hypothetical protein
MIVTTRVVWDWDGNVLARESYEYHGPVDLAKGGGYAQQNMATANKDSGEYTNQALGINASLQPTLQSEINNPIGFGQQALTQMQTQGGQDAAAQQAAAQQRATLAASRTGNLASLPAVQDQLARSGTQSADQNALGLDVANNSAKLQQQQQGISGLQQLGATDTGAGLNALGLSNSALQDYINSQTWNNALAGGVGSLVGNLGKGVSVPVGGGGAKV